MKKFLTLIMATLMLVTLVLPMTACAKTYKLSIEVEYWKESKEDSTAGEFVTDTLVFELYQNLAPKAVDKIVELVKEGKFENTVFYKESEYTNSVRLGGYAYKDGKYEERELTAIPDAEFPKNGTIGSNLKNERGTIGLWRAFDGDFDVNSEDIENTQDVFYMPTTTITSYNDWFCLIGKTENVDLISQISSIVGDSRYYEQYYFFTVDDVDYAMNKEEYDEYISDNGEPEDVTKIYFSTKVKVLSIKVA